MKKELSSHRVAQLMYGLKVSERERLINEDMIEAMNNGYIVATLEEDEPEDFDHIMFKLTDKGRELVEKKG
jgi:hypothetical protein